MQMGRAPLQAALTFKVANLAQITLGDLLGAVIRELALALGVDPAIVNAKLSSSPTGHRRSRTLLQAGGASAVYVVAVIGPYPPNVTQSQADSAANKVVQAPGTYFSGSFTSTFGVTSITGALLLAQAPPVSC